MHVYQWPSSVISTSEREKNRVTLVCPTLKLLLAILRHIFEDRNLD